MLRESSPTAARLAPFGESVFTRMSRLAAEHKAVNLGQGFPNFDGPEFVKLAGKSAIDGGFGQYARAFGLPELNRAIAARFRIDSGIEVDPEKEVTVTSGCTEAIAAVMLGLVEPGEEVVVVEPFYDSYGATIAMAGGVLRSVRLSPPDFSFPLEALKAVLTPRTRLILVNSPHNPTGRVFTDAELAGIAALAIQHDCLVVSDEVYEHIWFERRHRSIATLPGMRERTIVLSSLGKTFSLTGWKIGWAIAPPRFTQAIRSAHQFLTFCSATPLQRAAVDALAAPESYFTQLRSDYAKRRESLLGILRASGFDPFVPEGSYFVLARHEPFGFPTDEAFCEHLIKSVGVAAIPCSPFYAAAAGETGGDDPTRLIRFAFCKNIDTIEEAGRRLKQGLRPVAK
ncbi:MAG: aminotransferase class I/II-fold pyridoxal phosphate-dependent enzyme [Planctomycetes bacterium]|nr:aminotransferase class I/II-fold pyridoxal phosphate-dependent enzyme [Planctomycetota bacterium]